MYINLFINSLNVTLHPCEGLNMQISPASTHSHQLRILVHSTGLIQTCVWARK